MPLGQTAVSQQHELGIEAMVLQRVLPLILGVGGLRACNPLVECAANCESAHRSNQATATNMCQVTGMIEPGPASRSEVEGRAPAGLVQRAVLSQVVAHVPELLQCRAGAIRGRRQLGATAPTLASAAAAAEGPAPSSLLC